MMKIMIPINHQMMPPMNTAMTVSVLMTQTLMGLMVMMMMMEMLLELGQ